MKKAAAFISFLMSTLNACLGLAILLSALRWLTLLSITGWVWSYAMASSVFFFFLGVYLFTISTFKALELLFVCLGRYDLAERQVKKHISIYERIGWKPWLEKLNLADYYCEQGKYNDAESLLLSIDTSKIGYQGKAVESMLQPKLSRVYIAQERYNEAETILTKLLESRRKNKLARHISKYRFAGGFNEMYLEVLRKTNRLSEAKQFEDSTRKPLTLFENGQFNLQAFSILLVLLYVSFCVYAMSPAGTGPLFRMFLWPSVADVYVWRAFTRRDDRGIADCSKALLADPNHALAYWRRAEIYESQNKLDLAVADLNKTININNLGLLMYSGCLETRGSCYWKLGRWQNVIADYTKALGARSTIPTFPYGGNNKALRSDYFGRAYAYARVNEYSKALQDLNQAINIDPKFAAAYQNRAQAYEKLGQHDLAAKDRATAAEFR